MATLDAPSVVSTNGLYALLSDGTLQFNFHPGQQKAWDDPARFVLVLAGTQGGKTSWGPWWLWREILARGAGDYLAVTTNFDLFRLKMLPEMRRVFEGILRIGRYWPGARVIELRDPQSGKFLAKRVDDEMYGRIILRSISAPAGLESATASAAWLDEVGQDDWDVTNWEAILRRLALQQGRVLGTTTVYNEGWLKREWSDRAERGETDYSVIRFPSTTNPKFSEEEFQRAKNSLPEWRFRMFYLGEFAKPAGLIYKDFDDKTMIVPPFEVPPMWPRTVGVDFGGSNTATVTLVEDVSVTPSRFIAIHESHEGSMSAGAHVAKVRSLNSGARRIEYFGGSPGETQYRMDWSSAGIDVIQPVISEVEIGISAVIELIKTDRFRVFSSLSGLISELKTYRRKLDGEGDPTETIDRKNRFHRLDALRYAVSGVQSGMADTYVMY